MIFSRPFTNSERFLHLESTEYPSATLPGSREFQASSAILTFWIAVSRVNGGSGGRVMAAAVSTVSPVIPFEIGSPLN